MDKETRKAFLLGVLSFWAGLLIYSNWGWCGVGLVWEEHPIDALRRYRAFVDELKLALEVSTGEDGRLDNGPLFRLLDKRGLGEQE